MGHLHDNSFIRRRGGVQVEMGPVIVARLSQSWVSPVPVLHGVLQPVQIPPTPDMELPTKLKYSRVTILGAGSDPRTGGS